MESRLLDVNERMTPLLTRFDVFALFLVHFGVSMYVVAFGSVVNSELKFSGLSTSMITKIIAFITLIEMSRVFFAVLVDYRNFRIAVPVFLVGVLSMVVGNAILFLTVIDGSLMNIIALILASLGASILPTVVDGIFAKSSLREDRKLAMSLQSGRLLGFAIGGILVALLYGNFGHRVIFLIIAFSLLLIGLIGMISVFKVIKDISTLKLLERSSSISLRSFNPSRWMTNEVLRDLILVFIFLVLFGLGFFAQDSILELFSIEVLGFDRSMIGRITGVWGVATLLGVLVGGALMNRYSDKFIVSSGLIVASVGLVGISLANYLGSGSILAYLMIMVFLLGFGGGATSTPSIARLINLSKRTAIPLTIMGIVGIASTLTRSASAFIAGILVELRGFEFVFLIESLFLVLAMIPYVLTSHWDHLSRSPMVTEDSLTLSGSS